MIRSISLFVSPRLDEKLGMFHQCPMIVSPPSGLSSSWPALNVREIEAVQDLVDEGGRLAQSASGAVGPDISAQQSRGGIGGRI